MTAHARVVVADDHDPTRALVRQVLESGGFTIAAEVADGPAAIDAVVTHAADVALLDISMPGGGIEAATAIGRRSPSTAIVMLTVSDDDDDLFAALSAGAIGYLVKGADPTTLPATLRDVLDGEAALSGRLAAKLIGEFRTREHRRSLQARSRARDRLTDREIEVLELIADGLTTSQIADRLFVAQVTVRTHVSAILRKLHVRTRAEAVSVAELGRS